MTGYVADLSWKSGTRAIEKLDRLRSTMAANVLIYLDVKRPAGSLLSLCKAYVQFMYIQLIRISKLIVSSSYIDINWK